MNDKWLEWAKRIQALSQAGLTYSKDIYDIERFEELRNISVEIMEKYTGMEMKKIKQLFTNETGYPTPKVDVRGVVFKDGKLLMVQEKTDQCWALPGGFCEVGLSPAENVVKEIKEESSFDVLPIKLLAVLDMNKYSHPPQPYHYYKLFIQCEIVGGNASVGLETKAIQFFAENELPTLSTNRNTESQIKMIFEYLHNPTKAVSFD